MGTSAFERAWDTSSATPPAKPPTVPRADAFDAAWGTDTPPATPTPVAAPPAGRTSFLGTQARATAAGVGRSVLKTGARLARAIDTVLPGTRFDSGAGETLDRYADALLERLTPADPERAAEFRSGAGGAEMGTELVKYLATGTGASAAVGALRAATLGTVEDVGSRPGETGAALLAQGAEAVGADRAAAFLREQEQTAPGRAAVGAVLGAVPDVAFRLGRRRPRVPDAVSDAPSATARADVPEPELPPAAPDVPPIGNRMPPPAAVDEADITRQVDALRREIEAPDVPTATLPRAPEPPPEFIRPDEITGMKPVSPEIRAQVRASLAERPPMRPVREYWEMPVETLREQVPRAVPTSLAKMPDEQLVGLAVYRHRLMQEQVESTAMIEEVERILESVSTGRKMGYQRAKEMFGTAEDARRWQNVSEEAVDALGERGLTPQDITRMYEAQRKMTASAAAISRLDAEMARRGLSITPEAAPVPSSRSTPREYLNYAKFGLDKTNEARLREHVEGLRVFNEVDKGFQSFREQQALADEFAKEIVANPLDIDRVKLGKLSGAEIVGLRQVAAENTQMIEGLSQAIESGRLSVEEIREAEQMLEAAVESTNQVLSRVVRETAQTARDLGFLRKMAKLTTDPEAWVVRGKKLLGDAPMSDTVMLEIRRLAREAAEACG